MMAGGAYDHLVASQQLGDIAHERPDTAFRQRGKVALTVLDPNPEVKELCPLHQAYFM